MQILFSLDPGQMTLHIFLRFIRGTTSISHDTWARILKHVAIYRGLRIGRGRDDNIDQSEAYDIL